MPSNRFIHILFTVFTRCNTVKIFESTGEALRTGVAEIKRNFKYCFGCSAKFKRASRELVNARVFHRAIAGMLSEY